MTLDTKLVPIGMLESDPDNVRTHGKRNREAISRSLARFGQRKPLVVRTTGDDTYTVVAGNGTLEALRSLDVTEVDVAIVPGDWDGATARAYAIADNRTAELAGWDEDALRLQLDSLQGTWGDVEDLGFSVSDLTPAEIVEDDVPDPPRDPVTRRGDIVHLGRHTLVCGDATDSADMATLTGSVSMDCLITDPPYNVAYHGGTQDALTIANDDLDDDAFARMLDGSFALCGAAMRPGASFYVWHADTMRGAFLGACEHAGLDVHEVLVWVKSSMVMGRQDYQWRHEPCLYGWKAGSPHYFTDSRCEDTVIDDSAIDVAKMTKQELKGLVRDFMATGHPSTILRFDKPNRSEEHPTMKPVALFAYLIANSTRAGARVLDPYGGSGTTLVACEQLGRTCHTMDIDPGYCDVIVARWERLTGQTASYEHKEDI